MLFCGASTGGLVGLSLATLTRISNPMGSGWAALLTCVVIPTTSAVFIRQATQGRLYFTPPTWSLLLVAGLTLAIPVIGPVFGGTGYWRELPLITLLGIAGGGIWSLPLAGLFSAASGSKVGNNAASETSPLNGHYS